MDEAGDRVGEEFARGAYVSCCINKYNLKYIEYVLKLLILRSSRVISLKL